MWLARRLGVNEVPRRIWAYPLVQDMVRDYLADEEPLEGVLETVRGLFDIWRDGGQHATGQAQPLAPGSRGEQSVSRPRPNLFPLNGYDALFALNDYEKARVQAYSLHLANRAAQDDDVRAFRQEMLGGRLLTRDEALQFVTSPALRYCTPMECREWGIPLVGHTATLVEPEQTVQHGATAVYRVVIDVTPPGAVHRVERPVDSSREHYNFFFYDEEAEQLTLRFWRGTVIDALVTLCRKLIETYGWEMPETLRFVLCGQAPTVASIKGSHEVPAGYAPAPPPYAEIGLSLAPWLSDQTVLRAYRLMQQYLPDGERRERDSRRTNRRNLRIFCFVEERTATSNGSRPPWRQLMEDWNAAHLAERYIDYRRFARDYGRGRDILFPVTANPQ